MARRPAPTPRAVVAAASRPLADRRPSGGKPSDWQNDAWDYYDRIGELKYAVNFAGNQMAKLRLFAAVRVGDDPSSPPIAATDPEGQLDADTALAAEAELRRLHAATGGQGEVLREINQNLEVAGECYLVGYEERSALDPYGPAPEQWEVRSVSEVSFRGEGDQRMAIISGAPGTSGRELDPVRDTIIRIWQRHARWSDQADSAVRGVATDCESLLVLGQQAMAESRSRLSAGGFTVPNELNFETDDDDATEGDVFIDELMRALTDPVEDASSASSVMPMVIRGPAEYLRPEFLRRIEFGRGSNTGELEQKIEAKVLRLARGLNLPPEVVLGHQSTTFANAAQIDEDTFEKHFAPRAALLADALTAAFLRPNMIDAGLPPEVVNRIFVWYDADALIASPDPAAVADEAYDRNAISDAAYRRVRGFDESDAPEPLELMIRTGIRKGIFTADISLALLKLVYPELEVVPIPKAPDPNDDSTAAAIQGAVAALTAAGLLQHTNGAARPAGSTTAAPARRLGALVAGPSPPRPAGARLLAIDRELRTRLTVAAEAALERALERAGNRLKSKAGAMRDTLRMVAPRACAATLGPAVLAAAGVNEEDLLREAFDGLEPKWTAWGTQAGDKARDVVNEVVSGLSTAERDALKLRQADNLKTGWGWLHENLVTLAKARLYDPDPAAPEFGEFDPSLKIPPGVIRQAMAQAGGAAHITTNGANVFVQVPEGATGIATGADVQATVLAAGGSIEGFRWDYGDYLRTRPFHPHARLDGVYFRNFDDPVLANHGTFPPRAFFIPGDHPGCVCDVEPVVVGPAGAAELGWETDTQAQIEREQEAERKARAEADQEADDAFEERVHDELVDAIGGINHIDDMFAELAKENVKGFDGFFADLTQAEGEEAYEAYKVYRELGLNPRMAWEQVMLKLDPIGPVVKAWEATYQIDPKGRFADLARRYGKTNPDYLSIFKPDGFDLDAPAQHATLTMPAIPSPRDWIEERVAQIEALPDEWHEALANGGLHFSINPGQAYSDPALLGVQVGQGHGAARVSAMFSPGDRAIVLVNVPGASANVVAHEAAHAIDFIKGGKTNYWSYNNDGWVALWDRVQASNGAAIDRAIVGETDELNLAIYNSYRINPYYATGARTVHSQAVVGYLEAWAEGNASFAAGDWKAFLGPVTSRDESIVAAVEKFIAKHRFDLP